MKFSRKLREITQVITSETQIKWQEKKRKFCGSTYRCWINSKTNEKKKPVNSDYLVGIEPITDNQKRLFDSYSSGKHIVAYGAAGTGKTFITLYNALRDVLDETTPYEKFILLDHWLQQERLDSYQVTMKTNLHIIKYHTNIW